MPKMSFDKTKLESEVKWDSPDYFYKDYESKLTIYLRTIDVTSLARMCKNIIYHKWIADPNLDDDENDADNDFGFEKTDWMDQRYNITFILQGYKLWCEYRHQLREKLRVAHREQFKKQLDESANNDSLVADMFPNLESLNDPPPKSPPKGPPKRSLQDMIDTDVKGVWDPNYHYDPNNKRFKPNNYPKFDNGLSPTQVSSIYI